jgi:hypothetical protein
LSGELAAAAWLAPLARSATLSPQDDVAPNLV